MAEGEGGGSKSRRRDADSEWSVLGLLCFFIFYLGYSTFLLPRISAPSPTTPLAPIFSILAYPNSAPWNRATSVTDSDDKLRNLTFWSLASVLNTHTRALSPLLPVETRVPARLRDGRRREGIRPT